MTMNKYIADELANKVYHLYRSLNDANKTILLLEKENKLLKDAIYSDSSVSKDNIEIKNNLIAST